MDLAANLHDVIDPVREAQAQLAGVRDTAHTIVLLGAGLGFVTEAAATRWPTAAVVVIEPSAETARVAVTRTPALYDSGRVRVIVGPDYSGIADLWKVFDRPEAADAAGLAVVGHAALTQAMPAESAKAYHLLSRAIQAAKMNRQAREENAGRYLLNTLRNLPAILGSGDPAQLVGKLAGVPAIIVGAGPSLDRQLDDLRAVAGRAVIVAADTAWRPLVNAGIDPHFVIALDPTEANGRHLRGVASSRQTWAIVEGSVEPAAVNGFRNSLFTFRVANHHPWPWLQALNVQRPMVRAWGSVLTSALDLGLAFGCDPVVFVGADLAFTDGRPYCRGTSFEEDWARHTARGASLRQVWRNTLTARQLLKDTGIKGDSVLTAPHLIEFRNWIVGRANEAVSRSQRVCNATGDGILAGGPIQQVDLRGVFDARPECNTAIRQIVREHVAPPASLAVEGVLEALDSLANQSASTLDEWLTFGRPSLTIQAIRDAAIAAREASLTPAGDQPSAASRLPRPRIHPADRVARMRTRLTGDITGLDGCAHSALLEEFGETSPIDAAHECTDSLLALSRLTTGWGEDASNGSDPATVPLSLRYVWSADAKPLADALEAWLLHPALMETRNPAAGHPYEEAGFWAGRIIPTSDATSAGDDPASRAEDAARHALVEVHLELWLARRINRSARLTAAVAGARAFPNRLDGIMRAISGTIARPAAAARDPRLAFIQNEVAQIEPQVLTDRGLPLGWSVATADDQRAIFTPRLADHSIAIDGDGTFASMAPWPHPIVGEIPWGDAGGSLAWNSSAQLILYRPRHGDEARIDRVSFQPSRPLRTRPGTIVWLALDGGLWEWAPEQQPCLLIDTPKCAGLRMDEEELVLAPVARDASGYLLRRRLPFEYRYRVGEPALRQSTATREGPVACQISQGSWTAASHPFADLVRLDAADGRAFVLAVYSPLQLGWAGSSLVVTIADGSALLFPRLIDHLEGLG